MFRDIDNDGLFDEIDEPAPEGVLINLLDGGGVAIVDASGTPVTTTTDTRGQYVFAGLREGEYIVELDAENFVDGAPLDGLWASTGAGASDDPETSGDSNSDSVQGESVRSGVVILGLDSEPLDEADPSPTGIDSAFSNLTVDFGLYASAIDVQVEVPESVELPVEVVVTTGECDVIPGSDTEPMTAMVDETGTAAIHGIADGVVHVAVPAEAFDDGAALDGVVIGSLDDADQMVNGCLLTDPIEVLASEVLGQTIELALPQMVEGGTISDVVWNDEDGDGIRGASEGGIEGIEVRLVDGSATNIATQVSGPNGEYTFDDLVPGEYTIEITIPSGQIITLRDVGTDESVDSDLDPTTGRVAIIIGEGEMLAIGIGLTDPESTTPAALAFTGSGVQLPITIAIIFGVLGAAMLILERRKRLTFVDGREHC